MTKEPIMIDDVDVSECEHRCDTHKELLADGHIKEFVHYCQITNTGCYGYNCYYKQLKRKEQECEKLNDELLRTKCMVTTQGMENGRLYDQLDQLKAENEKMSKGYIELTEIVSPYINDFTGYNEELKGFDIVLCVKELMQQLDQFKTYHDDTVHTMLQVQCCLVDNCKKYEQALQGIKEIAENKLNWTADYKTYFKRDNKSIKQEGFKALAEILQKCEVINDTTRCN